MSLATYQGLMTSARSAFASGDYAEAESYATQAISALSELPDSQQMIGRGTQSMAFRTSLEAANAFIARCVKMQLRASVAASGPFQQFPVTYERAGSTSDE